MNLSYTAPWAIAVLGLLLGMRHATDPDHVIAVTAILSRERRFGTATRVGIVWGIGHTATVLAVGALIIIFKISIPARIGLAMEFTVALVLILLGLNAAGGIVRRLLRSRPSTLVASSHRHAFDRVRHSQLRDRGEADALTPLEMHDHRQMNEAGLGQLAIRRPMLRSFGVGLVHGLAGSAAIALLVLSAIPSAVWATLYLAIFCVGVIAGMSLITTAIGLPFTLAMRRMANVHQLMVTGAGLLSLGFGLFLAWQIGINDHLLGGAPIWIPH